MTVREQLIDATAELLRRRGVAGTAVSEILTTSGVARRSIYLNFPGGKGELVAAATQAAGDAMTAVIANLLAGPNPISGFVSVWSAMLEATDFDGGCPVVAAALGRTEAPDAADIAGRSFSHWRTMIVERLIAGGVAPHDAEPLATTILAAIEGAVILSQAQRSTSPLDDVQAVLGDLVAAKVGAS